MTTEHAVQEPETVILDSTLLEYAFFQSDEPNIYTALIAAIDHFAAQKMGFPDIVLMNMERRIGEVGPDYWHTVYHGAIPIKLRSPQDIEIDDLRDTPLLYNTFICVRHVARAEPLDNG